MRTDIRSELRRMFKRRGISPRKACELAGTGKNVLYGREPGMGLETLRNLIRVLKPNARERRKIVARMDLVE